MIKTTSTKKIIVWLKIVPKEWLIIIISSRFVDSYNDRTGIAEIFSVIILKRTYIEFYCLRNQCFAHIVVGFVYLRS
ncbi:MAG: hypothetical protein QME58_05610 [Bacteroidota bacterium]|nr:hypothetical protein [Bacteroidota bacterium]